MMKMKKLFAYGLMTVMAFGLLGQTRAEAYGGSQYETEENNNYETANYIELGNSVTGNISEYGDVDYYMVTPSENGQITLDFCHTYEDEDASWNVYVYLYKNGEYTKLSETRITLTSNEKVSLPYIGAVQDGIYYIKITEGYGRIEEVDYSINTQFTASDYFEKEDNNAYSTATDISLNHTYNGTIAQHGDDDYYKIVAPQNGKIALDFCHTYEDKSGVWGVSVYLYKNGEYTELSGTRIALTSNEKVSLPYIGAVQNGIYYIKVTTSDSEIYGVDYSINTQFTTSDYFEKEDNDAYSTATDILLNHSYSGTINKTYDKDYYKFIAPENGVIALNFIHNYENAYGYWKAYVYRYSNGEYKELSSLDIALDANKKVSFPKLGVVKGGIYYIKVERRSDETIVGKNYTIKAKFSTNAPSNLRAQVKDSTANLMWTKSGDADGYEIYCKAGKTSKYRKIATTKNGSYAYKYLEKGKAYKFKVRSYKKTGNETYYSTYAVVKNIKRK